MADPGILVKTRIAQQEVSLVANVDWKDISKSVARRNTNAKAEREKPSATGTQGRLRKYGRHASQNMRLLSEIKSKRKLKSLLEDVS